MNFYFYFYSDLEFCLFLLQINSLTQNYYVKSNNFKEYHLIFFFKKVDVMIFFFFFFFVIMFDENLHVSLLFILI